MRVNILAQSEGVEIPEWAGIDNGGLYVLTRLAGSGHMFEHDGWVLAQIGTETVLIRCGEIDSSNPGNVGVEIRAASSGYFEERIANLRDTSKGDADETASEIAFLETGLAAFEAARAG